MIDSTWFLLLLANNRAIKSYPALCTLHCIQIQAHPFNFCIVPLDIVLDVVQTLEVWRRRGQRLNLRE